MCVWLFRAKAAEGVEPWIKRSLMRILSCSWEKVGWPCAQTCLMLQSLLSLFSSNWPITMWCWNEHFKWRHTIMYNWKEITGTGKVITNPYRIWFKKIESVSHQSLHREAQLYYITFHLKLNILMSCLSYFLNLNITLIFLNIFLIKMKKKKTPNSLLILKKSYIHRSNKLIKK